MVQSHAPRPRSQRPRLRKYPPGHDHAPISHAPGTALRDTPFPGLAPPTRRCRLCKRVSLHMCVCELKAGAASAGALVDGFVTMVGLLSAFGERNVGL